MLLPVLGRDDRERRVLINTIGPVWDGNEVWLITAGGAMFAAFPEWYATLFSGFYLPLLLILLALIVRGVAFEYRGKRAEASLAAPLGRGDLRRLAAAGVPVGRRLRQHRARRAAGRRPRVRRRPAATCSTRTPCSAALTTLALFLTHGAVFLALKTAGDIRERAGALAGRGSALVAAVLAVGVPGLDADHPRQRGRRRARRRRGARPASARSAAARARREGWAFTGTAVAIAPGRGDAVRGAVPERACRPPWTRPAR